MNLAEYKALPRRGNHNAAHTRLVKACLAWLAAHRIPAWGMNTGAATVAATETSKGRFIRFAFPGCSDIIGVIPRGQCRGVFVAIECKTGKGVLTDDQKLYRDILQASGGAFFEVRAIEDLDGLAEMLRWKGRR